ncbi:MAG: DUF222 domain-containing protein, partial [Mycobacterium sp.]
TCGNPDCPAGGDDGRASNVVIHVVTEASALQAQPDPQMSGKVNQPQPNPPPETKARPAGLLMRGGIVPAPLLADLIRSGARVSQVRVPGDAPEPGYRPSAKLDEFVRVRDLTCRFPGCEEPAEFCDIDHTIPYPVGPTHPSNLKCLCRKHHLLKTFWTGINGWADRQLADGRVIWTSPTGKTYNTMPGGRIFFPDWEITAAALPGPRKPLADMDNRGLMMPRRQCTRAADLARRIEEERALNAVARMTELAANDNAVRNKPPPTDPWEIRTRSDTCDDPPPF